MKKLLDDFLPLIPYSLFLLAYFLIEMYQQLRPNEIIKLDIKSPLYKDQIIGRIPNSEVRSKYGTLIIGDSGKEDVYGNVPQFDGCHMPIFVTTTKSFIGRGSFKIQISYSEITQAALDTPSYRTERVSNADNGIPDPGLGSQQTFTYFHIANIIQKGTNILYPVKEVEFDQGFDPEQFYKIGESVSLFITLIFIIKKYRKDIFEI
jgi:hypothetical protein